MLIDSFWFRMHNERIFPLDMLWIYSLVTSLAITAQLNLLVGDVSGYEDSEMYSWIEFSLCDGGKMWRILSVYLRCAHHGNTRISSSYWDIGWQSMCVTRGGGWNSQISTLPDLIYSSMSASKSHHERKMWRQSSRCFITRDETNDVDAHQYENEQLSRRCGMRK